MSASSHHISQHSPKCSKPGLIQVDSNGSTREVFQKDCEKAYLVFENLCYDRADRVSKPVSIYKNTGLKFNVLSAYTITLTLYPEGCPFAQLSLNLETSSLDPLLTLQVSHGLNSITVVGSTIPVGTVLKFWVDANLLRYFKCVKLAGTIQISPAGAEMNVIVERDNHNKVAYISTRPPFFCLTPPLPFPAPGVNPILPGQYPQADSVYPWTQALIPWEKNQPFPSGSDVIVTPPDPVPPTPPYVNGYGHQYDKFRSVPDGVLFYLGYDALSVNPKQEDWTLFLRNFVDRGYAQTSPDQEEWQIANFAKRQYIAALSIDKLQFYLEKIDAFVKTAYTEVVANGKPLVSSFRQNVTLFFLRIHIGERDFPDYVVEYFNRFMDFVGIGNGNLPEAKEILLYGNQLAPKIVDYFNQAAIDVVAKEDKSSIAYWWNLAGMSSKSLLFECVHNQNAFNQFNNVLYSVIYAALHPTNPLNPALPPYPNFFDKYREAVGGENKLNVVREVFRILSPNTNSFSRVNPGEAPSQLAFHLHQQIMIENNPYNPAIPIPPQTQQLISYFSYNPDQYNNGFRTNLDNLEGLPVSMDFIHDLPTSGLDQETVVDISRPVVPIFPKPIYSPFGLGYRRCAGEIFVYLVTEKILDYFGQAGYKESVGPYPSVYIAAFKPVPDNIFAVQPF